MTGAGPPPLLLIGVVAGVWAVLLLTAFLARAAARSRWQAALAVAVVYVVLGAAAVVRVGGVLGWVAAAGMLFPFAVAMVLAMWHFPWSRRAVRVAPPTTGPRR